VVLNKELSADAVVAQLRDGMTIGIGGWGPRRKPMSLVRALLRSPLRNLTIVGYGGPDMGMLCAAGKAQKLIYAFVSLDFIPLEPFFRKAREAGAIEAMELDEGLLHWGLRAAAMRLPFLPTRVGLGSDLLRINPGLRMVTSPYEDAGTGRGEVLLAMPALKLDVALLHVHTADRMGNTRLYSPDPFFDELFARAADACYVSCEQLLDRLDSADEADARNNPYERSLVNGVVAAQGGAHPTSNIPGYGWDAAHLKRYCDAAEDEGGWERYAREFLAGDEPGYQRSVGGLDRILSLPRQVL